MVVSMTLTDSIYSEQLDLLHASSASAATHSHIQLFTHSKM